MDRRSQFPLSRPVYYLDTNVLLNHFAGMGRRAESRAAKKLMRKIEKGEAEAVVSTWALMEIITVVRKALARKKITKLEDIEPRVESIIGNIYRIRNLNVVSGTPMEMAQLSKSPPLLWEILEFGLEHMREALYVVSLNNSRKEYVIDGIGGNDALHISLAKHFGCDFLATFDTGFWADDRPISIYDVMNDVER